MHKIFNNEFVGMEKSEIEWKLLLDVAIPLIQQGPFSMGVCYIVRVGWVCRLTEINSVRMARYH